MKIFLHVFLSANYTFFYYSMKKSEGNGAQNCESDDDLQSPLSQKIGQLNQVSIDVKFLFSLTNGNQEPASMKNNDSQVMPERVQEKQNDRALRQLNKESDFHKKARSKRTSCPIKTPISLDSVRIFQILETPKCRTSFLKEVKNRKISEFTGRGVIVLPNSKKYEGEWIDGQLIGQVKITNAQGDIYLGDVYEYQKHGKGYLYYYTGEKYVGEFSYGDFHGEGILYDWLGQVVFDGEWRRGKMLKR